MLSASPGSLSNRYRIAFSSAAGIPSLESGFRLNMGASLILWPQSSPQPAERIVKLIHHSLLERNDGVVGYGDVLRAHVGATFGDVAVTDIEGVLQFLHAVLRVKRMHFKCSDMN